MSRTPTFNIVRHTPDAPNSLPRMEVFTLEHAPDMSLFITLNLTGEEQGPKKRCSEHRTKII